MKFLPLARSHISEIMDIDRLAFPEPWSKKLWIKELAQSHRSYYVATDNEEVVGYGGGLIAGTDFHITTIAVRQPDLNRGIASWIIIKLLESAIEMGATDLTLEVRVGNLPAQALYRKFGMVPAGIRRAYYQPDNEDALIMWANDIDQSSYLEQIRTLKRTLACRESISP
jgi:ribosomal-protein-alanine N-acetyltransferase